MTNASKELLIDLLEMVSLTRDQSAGLQLAYDPIDFLIDILKEPKA